MAPKSKRPKNNMQNYTKEDMTEAVRVVNEGMHSISEVACMFNIPRKTLCDRVHGNHYGSIGAQTTPTFFFYFFSIKNKSTRLDKN